MNSYRRNDRRGNGALIVATAVVIAVVALDLLSGGGIRALVRAGGIRVWSMGSQAASAIGGSGFFSSRRALLAENESLKEEVARLTLRIALLGALEKENETLRAIANVAADLPGVAAPIVSPFSSSPYGTFVIGAGRQETVGPGDLVVAGEQGKGFVIGRVSEVYEHASLATQLFAPSASIEAVIGDMSLTLDGYGAGNARAEVPRAATVAESDMVRSPGARGLPIGVVGSIAQGPASAYQTVYVGLPVNLAALTFIYVIPASR